MRGRADFALYLAAVALLPFKWLSPISALSERAGWADILFAAAFVAWVVTKSRDRAFVPPPRPWQVALIAFLGLTALSAAAAPSGTTAVWTNVVITAEMIALAFMTADFALDGGRRRAIVTVVFWSALVTAALAAAGLVLFYGGVDTSLLGSYGEQLVASTRYARVDAGFYSPPLLASYCIFASALVARTDCGLSGKARRIAQIALALTAMSTLSRGLLGFVAAAAIRVAAGDRGRRIAATAVTIGCIAVIGALTVGGLHIDPTQPGSASYHVPDPGGRREALATSLATLEDHPVLGTGPGSLTARIAGTPYRAHFTPLNVAATVGLPALAALLAAVALLWRGRRRPTDIATWSGLAGLAIDGLAQDVDHFRHVWLLLGFAAALNSRGAPADTSGAG